MARFVAAVASCLMVLAGCVTMEERYAPDEGRAYALNCGAALGAWSNCYMAAGEACAGAGYRTFDRPSQNVPLASANGNASAYAVSAVNTNERTTLIACKAR